LLAKTRRETADALIAAADFDRVLTLFTGKAIAERHRWRLEARPHLTEAHAGAPDARIDGPSFVGRLRPGGGGARRGVA
jgi:hypothetical protein